MQAINILIALLNTAADAALAAQKVSALIAQAKSEGRDVTQAELDSLVDEDDQARNLLQQVIDEARSSGANSG